MRRVCENCWRIGNPVLFRCCGRLRSSRLLRRSRSGRDLIHLPCDIARPVRPVRETRAKAAQGVKGVRYRNIWMQFISSSRVLGRVDVRQGATLALT